MKRSILTLERPFIRLRRFPHRCGYGVHSPFAFNLITRVIYEHAPYYKYRELRQAEREQSARQPKGWRDEPLRVKRLLFRLVNHTRPRLTVDAGTPAASALYLRAARQSADYTAASSLSELFLERGVTVDFLYVHDYRHPEFVEEVFRVCAPRAAKESLFVVEGIRYTRQMHALWKRMQQDERTGISFDLYDLGLLFFDKTKVKQHYIVNF